MAPSPSCSTVTPRILPSWRPGPLTGWRRSRRIGPPGDQTAVWARIGDDIAVAVCAETVGAADRALQMAIEYSKQRVQFDRPIATFQVIKHKIVDMLHQLELARVALRFDRVHYSRRPPPARLSWPKRPPW